MKFNFKKENLLDTILAIASAVFLFLAFMGIFAPVAVFKGGWGTLEIAFGAAAGSGEATLEASLAFAILALIFTAALVELVQLELFEVLPKDKKWTKIVHLARLGLAAAIIVFALISIACAGGWAGKNGYRVGAGSAMHFVFSFLAAGCGACVGYKNIKSLFVKDEVADTAEKDDEEDQDDETDDDEE